MPNRNVHLPVSITVGAGVATLVASDEAFSVKLARAFGGFLGGGCGGLLPDIFDPPRNGPNHRSVGHGILPIGGALVLGRDALIELRGRIKEFADDRRADGMIMLALAAEFLIGTIDGLIAGYVAHLALDATTPRGLPLVA